MINWYSDCELAVEFSEKPDIKVRYCSLCDEHEAKRQIYSKPFVLCGALGVCLFDLVRKEQYSFEIQDGYAWDGASIPRFFWRVAGAKTDPRFLVPSLVHDFLCENHAVVDSDRYFSSRVFERLLYVSGVNAFNRWMMFHSVDNFQKFCSWKEE